MDPGKKGLLEECSVRAVHEGYEVSFIAGTTWRFATLKTTDMTLGDVLEVLKKRPMTDMDDGDFPGVLNEESNDGGTEYYEIEWQDDTPEEIKESADFFDLYFSGDIDCECSFVGVESIIIEIDGETHTFERED